MRNSWNKLTFAAAITLISSLIAACGEDGEDSATVTVTVSVSQETASPLTTEGVIPTTTVMPAKTTANTTTASPKTTTAPPKTSTATTTAPAPTSVTTTTAPPKTPTATTTTAPAPAPTSYTVTTQGLSFSPSSLTVAVNSTVTFQVGGGHNLAWDCMGTPNTGTVTRTFTAPGRYEYCCTNHGGMTGVIIVQ